MSFRLHHTCLAARLSPRRLTSGSATYFQVDARGPFDVLFPGVLAKRATASFVHRYKPPTTDEPEPVGGPPRHGTHPLHGGVRFETKTIPVTLRVFTPDGVEFTAPQVTLADLERFRDLRGSPAGRWSYRATGESARFELEAESDERIVNAKGTVAVVVEETVRSESAPPLVADAPLGASRQSFAFDLFRVGTFVAEVSGAPPGAAWNGSMRLLDPDGTAVARGTGKTLTFPVGLATLGTSRDAAGRARPWTLEVSPHGGVVVGSPRLLATVIGSSRLHLPVLTKRIDRMLGPRGAYWKLYGENANGEALARLLITDPVAAETIDMHGLLSKPLRETEQDEPADPGNVHAGVVFTLGRTSEDLAHGTTLDVSTLKVDTIDFVVGSASQPVGSTPAVRLTLAVSGQLKLKLGPATLVEASVRGGRLELEVGLTLEADGTPRIGTWIRPDPFVVSVHPGAVVALAVLVGPLAAVAVVELTDYLEGVANGKVKAAVEGLLSDPGLAPAMMMMILGAHLDHRSIRVEGGAIVFEHVAPLEPEPKPRPGYAGAIGRALLDVGTGLGSFLPKSLGDTWSAANLGKIEHVVVVMMENRSYDHVLGYRALGPAGDGADGLTGPMVEAIQAAEGGHVVRNLEQADFPWNAFRLKTRIPKPVGHELADVREQLSTRAVGPDLRPINGPKGFVSNFLPRLKDAQGHDVSEGMVADDVLGYYDHAALPFFAYLARNYAYCDRYFSSHPGPTLPNRMYSLTGDVQHDRFGAPILDNNHGDDFLLSRATTIYDLLSRKGIPWRVYESDPSVTMLRMFARYAGNDAEIVSRSRLEADVARGDLPAFTAIEPAMHHHPQDDDHPDADMYRGQKFLRDVYVALRSNPRVWEKTLLIVTYDEHGGFYDHVVPPVADVLAVRGRGLDVAVGPRTTGAPSGSPPSAPATLTIPYGVRVPTFVVSPWVKQGVHSEALDHCSILKTVLARFVGEGRPFLSDRVHASRSFEEFLSEPSPRRVAESPPAIEELPIDVRRLVPGASLVVTPPLSRKAMRDGPVDFHQLTGRLARMLGR